MGAFSHEVERYELRRFGPAAPSPAARRELSLLAGVEILDALRAGTACSRIYLPAVASDHPLAGHPLGVGMAF